MDFFRRHVKQSSDISAGWIWYPASGILTVCILLPSISSAQIETDFSGGGGLRIGDSNTACTSGVSGALRYDSDGSNKVGFCDGSQWLDFLTGPLTFDGHSLDASDGSPTNALFVDANGSVGVGTVTPNANLHVVGQSVVSSTTSYNMATLSSGINNTVTTLPVNNTTGYPDQGTLALYKEIVTYTGKTANSFTGVTRGAFGTGADTHSSGRRVEKVNFMVHEGGSAQLMVRSSRAVQGGDGRATGMYSTAFGRAQAGNENSFAAGGQGTWAFADNSFVFGDGAQTYGGGHSLAIGNEARAYGSNAIALGTKVNTGVAFGWNGFGNYSMALGLGQAAGTAPEVRGTSSFGIFMGDQSGVSVTSSNVMVVMGGNLGVNTTSPGERLTVNGTIHSTSGGVRFPDNSVQTTAANPVRMMMVSDQKASGTAGGGITAGTWTTRVLNTVDLNTITGASLSSNQITLPAGTYAVNAFAQANQIDQNRLVLFNVTDNANQLLSINNMAHFDATRSTVAMSGAFTITASKVFELRHRSSTTRATDALGQATSYGINEVYAQIQILKID